MVNVVFTPASSLPDVSLCKDSSKDCIQVLLTDFAKYCATLGKLHTQSKIQRHSSALQLWTQPAQLYFSFRASVWFCRFCCITRTTPSNFQGTWPHPCRVSSDRALSIYNALVQVERKWTRVQVVAENMSIYDLEVHEKNKTSQRFCSVIRDARFHWAWTHTCCTNRNDHSIAGVVGHNVALLLVREE